MAESNLKLRAQAEFGQLTAWTDAVRRAREEMEALNAATGGGPMGGGGGTPPTGGMPPMGAGPPPTTGGTYGAGGPDDVALGPPISGGPGGGGARIGGGGGGGGFMSALGRGARGTGSFLSRAASTAVGVGLGTSITGFFMQSGQKYLELSRVMAQLDARFASSKGSAGYGYGMGYTMGLSAPMLEAYGAESRTVNRDDFLRTTGFARYLGQDPTSTLSAVGGIGRMTMSGVGDERLAEILGTAIATKMDEGRFGEFLQTTQRLTEQMLEQSGAADLRSVLGAQGLPAAFFGADDPRSQGSRGAAFLGQLSQGMQSGPMRTLMLRQMLGTEGMGYMDAMTELGRGAFSRENVRRMLGGITGMGLESEEEIFLALQGSLPGLNAGTLRDMARSVAGGGLEQALAAYDVSQGEGAAVLSKFGDFTKAGQSRITKGEGLAVSTEGMQLKLGATVAQVMVDLQASIFNLAGAFEKLLGMDVGGLVTDLTGSLKNLTGKLDSIAGMLPEGATVAGGVSNIGTDIGNRYGAAHGLQVSGKELDAAESYLYSTLTMFGPGYLAGQVLESQGYYPPMPITPGAREAEARRRAGKSRGDR